MPFFSVSAFFFLLFLDRISCRSHFLPPGFCASFASTVSNSCLSYIDCVIQLQHDLLPGDIFNFSSHRGNRIKITPLIDMKIAAQNWNDNWILAITQPSRSTYSSQCFIVQHNAIYFQLNCNFISFLQRIGLRSNVKNDEIVFLHFVPATLCFEATIFCLRNRSAKSIIIIIVEERENSRRSIGEHCTWEQ